MNEITNIITYKITNRSIIKKLSSSVLFKIKEEFTSNVTTLHHGKCVHFVLLVFSFSLPTDDNNYAQFVRKSVCWVLKIENKTPVLNIV